MEQGPVDDHEANGTVERAVQTVGGLIRTHKLALEQAYGHVLEAGHVVAPWLIAHAAVMPSLFEVGSDGLTAYERTRGKKYRPELPIFGVCVYYLPLGRTRGKANNLSAKWLMGVYLGFET